MTTQHTPGPWTILDGAILCEHVNAFGNFSHALTEVMLALITREDRANARLIAAAPDLLAACEAARAALETCDPWTEIGPSGQGGDELGMKFDESLVEAAKVATDAAIAKAKGTP